MSDRLIELTKQNTTDFINPFAYEYGDNAEQFADNLIANGVTVQEWISVKDRLPEKGGCYLIRQKAETWIGEVIQTAHWKETEQKFRGAQAGCFMEFVTHWMPLPQSPKGE